MRLDVPAAAALTFIIDPVGGELRAQAFGRFASSGRLLVLGNAGCRPPRPPAAPGTASRSCWKIYAHCIDG